ncbi:GGDEF domain-containing protein [Geodermatophilus sabuli]|uniref:Diguanylate cyclase (GGDEF) domain-containing protein n=1 Tax=Geodermatophilus sabuli TaxID=1564158 RepID=A0A285E9X7_9ACTN|nr:GGDEF domain-containing protein [Geodermatophilus sabuli]MBB3082231.1 diguanylate cyclase (GGDEF)-like protein [Geodermatophilus sabuli]SNX94896.1 diguanylate cyclase (GGDEF) domain-containing protein [Geodermatophilus sabuli]
MSARQRIDTDTRTRAHDTAVSRGPEHRIAARTLAGLTALGGLVGSVNLFVDGTLHAGTTRVFYAVAMLACLVAAAPLAVRQRAGRWPTFGLVLLCDLVYVIVVLSMSQPAHAAPLLLLFPSFVAAWFLGAWMVAGSMLVTVLACGIAMVHTYDGAVLIAVQTAISAGVLNGASVGVHVLRCRVQRLLEATRALSHQDPLTGLANRRHLVENAPRIWRQARREGSRVAAMVLDLDHFKRLNDAHGHAAGDAVLRAVAASLSATVRPTDVLARVGGEELVVLGLVNDAADAGRLAERLRTAVATSRSAAGHSVTASIGIALVRPVDGEDATAATWRLIDRADGAMYEAKQAGRDRVAAVLPRQRTAGDHLPAAGEPA